MKKLSIEEKARNYDEAIEKAKDYYHLGDDKHKMAIDAKAVMEYIFPELKESEDERMIQYFKNLAPFDKADELYEKYGFSHKDAVAWLEKQGEHAKFRDSIQVGDKVTRNQDGVLVNLSQLKRVAKPAEVQGEQKPYGQRKECTDCQFNYAGECKGYCDMKQGEQKPTEWTSEDEEELKIALNTLEKAGQYSSAKWLKNVCLVPQTMQKPAWSEKYIADVFEKVGLAKIVREQNNDNLTNALQDAMIELSKFTPQPKQEWSEEDEAVLDALIRRLEGEDIYVSPHLAVKCLKSLKDKVQLQPMQQWSGGDEAHLHSLITHLEQWIESNPDTTGADIQGENIAWLKSLRPQNGWRPSDEQMKALKDALNDAICQYDFKGSLIKEEITRKHAETIESLYNDLKKL